MNIERFNRFTDLLKHTTPSMEIKYKNKSWIMQILSFVLFFNKNFVDHFVTTLPFIDTVYFPNKEFLEKDLYSSACTLAHEWKHIKDSHKYSPFIYSLIYLSPQVLCLLTIPLAFFIGWWSLLFLIFLVPIPSYGRMILERNGYMMSLFVTNECLKEFGVSERNRAEHLSSLARTIDQNNFRSSSYYWMWPCGVNKYLQSVVKQIVSGDILDIDEDFRIVQEAFTKSKTTK